MTKGFVVLSIGHSKSNHLGAQGTFKGALCAEVDRIEAAFSYSNCTKADYCGAATHNRPRFQFQILDRQIQIKIYSYIS